MKPFALLSTGIILSLFIFSVYAFDLHFLKHSPARHFTKQDWDIAKTATRDILENHEPGDSVIWDNPDSGSSGNIKIISAGNNNGRPCKLLRIANRAKGEEHSSSYMFCKQSDGKWKAVLSK